MVLRVNTATRRANKLMWRLIFLLSVSCFIAACDPSQPSDSVSVDDFYPSGAAEPLKQATFDQLSPENQYLVANKVLSMMQKGIPVDEFFDISNGIDTLKIKQTRFIDDLRQALRTEMDSVDKSLINDQIYGVTETGLPDNDLAKYTFRRAEDEPRLLPLAQIMEYPLSRDMFAVWIAHFLANTILFSPAYEMESTDEIDILRVHDFLETSVLNGKPVRQIVLDFLPNVSRWRVSRSAENHALEAYELYLGLFDTAEDSRKGGIACQEFYLTGNAAGYQLAKTAFENTQPQTILKDYVVTSCNDLYTVVANHPLLMLRVTEVIANYFLDGVSSEERLAVIESIVNSGAVTFEDIFKGLLFSKAFLLDTERPISYENNLFSMLDRLRADRLGGSFYDGNIFNDVAGGSFFTDRTENMKRMGWASSEYKIGRPPIVPMDAMSFASYHKAMREHLFSSTGAWDGGGARWNDQMAYQNHIGLVFEGHDDDDADTDINNTKIRDDIASMNFEQFLDYLFLTTLSRRALSDEVADLQQYILDNHNWINDRDTPGIYFVDDNDQENVAEAVFDYISRLPEFYYHKAIN